MLKPVPTRTDPIKSGFYRHTKTGNLYEVLGETLHSETLEELVRYRRVSAEDSIEWSRPKQMWFADVVIDGQRVPRFQWSFEHNK